MTARAKKPNIPAKQSLDVEHRKRCFEVAYTNCPSCPPMVEEVRAENEANAVQALLDMGSEVFDVIGIKGCDKPPRRQPRPPRPEVVRWTEHKERELKKRWREGRRRYREEHKRKMQEWSRRLLEGD